MRMPGIVHTATAGLGLLPPAAPGVPGAHTHDAGHVQQGLEPSTLSCAWSARHAQS